MSHKQNLLVELFVEELPPRALRTLGQAFANGMRDALTRIGLAEDSSVVTAFATPRRLAVHLTGIADRAQDRSQAQKLMPVSVGFDAAGNATPALLKRLAALGAPADAVAGLRRASDGKAEALYLDTVARGATLADGLQEALQDAIAGLPIPKVMSYQLHERCELPGWTSVSFVRPAHGLVALHGAQVVPVQALGLAAGRATRGHRFEAGVDPIELRDADSYADQLEREGAVIASYEERRADIARQLRAAAEAAGEGLHPIDDEALLDEVTALVERPNVLVCQFDPAFLEVPAECLILTMKANQKYFPLLDPSGALTHRFLVVSNIRPDDASAVVGGNERVVRPRLADAKFFFDQDRRSSLASRVAALDKVVYHNRLGSQGERTQRVVRIAAAIAARFDDAALARHAVDAARLAKADLVTDMVGEFPELQGTMGRYYALHDGLDRDVADAIEDHYKPRFSGDTLPRGRTGMVVALADKLETLVGMFAIGNLPSGDRDPYALRRHALGIIRMLLEGGLNLSLRDLLGDAFSAFDGIRNKDESALADPTLAIEDFVFDRLAGLLREQGARAQEIEAVLAPRPARLADVPRLLSAVRAFAEWPESSALAAANKRIGNILKKAPEADAHVSALLLSAPAEKSLHAAMQQIVPAADAHFEQGDYTASLKLLAGLRDPVDAFFDGVMVNDEQPDVRLNRLGLLKSLHRAMNRVAQLERLAG